MVLSRIVNKILQLHDKVVSIIAPFGKVVDLEEIIVVVDSNKPIINSTKLEVNNNTINLLVVSKNILVADVYYDVLGGIIASKLTSLHKILYDKGLWANKLIEEYKEKIINREIAFLSSLGNIVSYARIPAEYFPVKNISVHAKVNTSLLNIIAKAYNILKDKLLLMMRKEYEYLLKNVASKHGSTIIFSEGYVRIAAGSVKSPIVKTTRAFKETIMPITSQLLGMITGIQKTINGEVSGVSIPKLFKYPHLLIQLDEGLLALGDWREIITEELGRIEKLGKHSPIDSAELYSMGNEKLVVKQYFTLSGIKWVLASIVASILKRFSVLPGERQLNEYTAILELKKNNIPSRDIVLVDPISYVTVFKYVEGESLPQVAREHLSKAYRLVGELIGSIHSIGIVVGDTKPENFIYNNVAGRVYVIDLEQSRKSQRIEEQAWDIAMFIYFHALPNMANKAMYLEKFLEGYTSVAGSKAISEAAKIKYMIPFTSIAPIQQLVKLHGLLKKYYII